MKKLIFLLAIVFLTNLAAANSATFKITEELVNVEIQLTKNDTILLPEDYENLETEQDYELLGNLLFSKNPGKIKFTSKSLLKETKEEEIFITPRFSDQPLNVEVILPEGYVVSKKLIIPKDYETSSNGRNIILTWPDFDSEEIIIFYEKPSSQNIALPLIAIILILTTIIFYFQTNKHKKKVKLIEEKQKKVVAKVQTKKKELITHNLFGEEKKIIEYLLTKKGKSCWTKEIVKDLEIPKVRLSRKIRTLTEKGLVEKEPHGNENRISLIKR